MDSRDFSAPEGSVVTALFCKGLKVSTGGVVLLTHAVVEKAPGAYSVA
jgi:hypothetical protein